MGQAFDEQTGMSVLQLKLVDDDNEWIEKSGEKEIIHTTEPYTFSRRG